MVLRPNVSLDQMDFIALILLCIVFHGAAYLPRPAQTLSSAWLVAVGQLPRSQPRKPTCTHYRPCDPARGGSPAELPGMHASTIP